MTPLSLAQTLGQGIEAALLEVVNAAKPEGYPEFSGFRSVISRKDGTIFMEAQGDGDAIYPVTLTQDDKVQFHPRQ